MIKIDELTNIRAELDGLEEDDVLEVNDDNEKRLYVLMRAETYDKFLHYQEVCGGGNFIRVEPQIKILNREDMELSYEDYEKIKKQLMDIFDQTFKPKPERMN